AMRLTVEGGPPLQVRFEPLVESKDPSAWLLLRREEPEQTALPDARVRWQQEFLLEPRLPGPQKVVLGAVEIREKDGEWRKITFKPIDVQVEVRFAKPDPQDVLKQLRGGTAIEELPPAPPRANPWPWLAGGGAVVVLALAAWLWRRRRRPAILLTPGQWAQRELDRLVTLNLPERGEVERFHTLLSNVLRRFVERRFQVPARRQTTPE